MNPGDKIHFTYTRPTMEVVRVKLTILRVSAEYVVCRAPDRMMADPWAPKGYAEFSAIPTSAKNRFRFTREVAQRALVRK
jgi:hypothetical protein